MKNKLFISIPMNGRDEIEVRKEMTEIVEELNLIYTSMDATPYELIDTMYTDDIPEDDKHGAYYLGKAIQDLSKADFVVFAPGWKEAHGCLIEKLVCTLYDIPFMDMIDLVEEDDTEELENASL